MSTAIDTLLNDSALDAGLRQIAQAVKAEERLSVEQGIYLYEHAPLGYLGVLANFIREKKHGDKTYFNRNFHLEPTNVCLYTCTFCSYSRRIKKREDGWELTLEEMMEIIKKYDEEPVTEVHIVGGVLPQYDLGFYSQLFSQIRAHRPDLHVKALTPVEYHYIFKKAKVSYEEGMRLMKEAGLQSMPGGGAEIFHPEIREQIAKDKCTGDQWLRIHEIWHELGMHSNATMLYGHIEEYKHRVDHMEQLRQLQDKTGGFQTFIPLKFRNQNNELSHLPESSAVEDLRNYAIARIYMDNFEHIKAYWPMIGRTTAQLSLAFGVDDIDGTIDDTTKIYSMAGSEEQNPALSTEELVQLIKAVGRHPIERGTLYNVVQDYQDFDFSQQPKKVKKGFVGLPVIDKTKA
ncbi:aminofutalosine synthase MqnE [Saprospira sp. CCB-QB6]|uniref:aminofutalosine synthase MqnE n=1 Tax=Saprospira sp. CCB-QB6 TaxID=3023936 RepID=UPI00234A99FD|nr:aminofutalosine synthase MqnE [Saprospira sp. CCB-QB6]WCL81152.1 aminofutalosine synthase MqnE [Saprospira sp. CCB-QB6]